ncbi:uncharacterized protein LOC128460011 isoform X2 [Pleuronectes platessa]|uniref:uncharacterized protein LOC128460011 isoform X2 n=1 Tax=Pleuronectes platessa TaxID=8262 RepID=UPI00232A765D|nr:uncharacterized protein LOC128460011 isoform X2 [Pleuronectes platessa]
MKPETRLRTGCRSLEASVSVKPPGPNIYLGESVLLQCTVESLSAFVKSYWWFRSKPHRAPTPRHLVSGDSYFITAVTQEYADRYWCQAECQENRIEVELKARPVSLGVSDGDIILKTQASRVFTDDDVTLCCQYQSGKHKQTSFFKNRALIDSNSSSGSDRVIKMTLKNVTREDEGFYRCASHDSQLQSPESWLSVRPDRGNFTSEETPASTGSWKWIFASCGVLLLIVIPLTVWLVCHYKYQKFCTWSCWPVSKQEVPAGVLPATKLDVTEVQWDLSWMEMSNLLEKDSYCGT